MCVCVCVCVCLCACVCVCVCVCALTFFVSMSSRASAAARLAAADLAAFDCFGSCVVRGRRVMLRSRVRYEDRQTLANVESDGRRVEHCFNQTAYTQKQHASTGHRDYPTLSSAACFLSC